MCAMYWWSIWKSSSYYYYYLNGSCDRARGCFNSLKPITAKDLSQIDLCFKGRNSRSSAKTNMSAKIDTYIIKNHGQQPGPVTMQWPIKFISPNLCSQTLSLSTSLHVLICVSDCPSFKLVTKNSFWSVS